MPNFEGYKNINAVVQYYILLHYLLSDFNNDKQEHVLDSIYIYFSFNMFKLNYSMKNDILITILKISIRSLNVHNSMPFLKDFPSRELIFFMKSWNSVVFLCLG